MINILRPDRGLQDRPPQYGSRSAPQTPYTCLFVALLAPVIHIDTKQLLGQQSLMSLYKIKTLYINRQANIASSKSTSLSTSIM